MPASIILKLVVRADTVLNSIIRHPISFPTFQVTKNTSLCLPFYILEKKRKT